MFSDTPRFLAPHTDTVCRVLEQLDTAEVNAAYARCRAAQMAALHDDADELMDGKTHRLGVMLAADAITVAQLDVSSKSNEITAFIPLLEQVPCLRNVVINADMMHTQRKHARYLHRRGAYFVLPVGENQPGLFDQLDARTGKPSRSYDRGHGRQEIRTFQVRPASQRSQVPTK